MEEVRDSIAAAKNDEHTFPYMPPTSLTRVLAQLTELGVEQRKQRDDLEHLKLWVHRLLNPNGDGTDTGAPTLPDPQDGI